MMFRNREEAGRLIATRLKSRKLENPLILAIPRGGVVVGAAIARELNAELDVVLARKLHAPGRPELAMGAVGEDASLFILPEADELARAIPKYFEAECERERCELQKRHRLYRADRESSVVSGRSVVVVDDGIATGSTLIAALQFVRTQSPFEVIVAVPVASPSQLAQVRRWCDDIVCLSTPADFFAVGQYYRDFDPVEDDELVKLLNVDAEDVRIDKGPANPIAVTHGRIDRAAGAENFDVGVPEDSPDTLILE
jgi:putative phosphoribosyl transferase